MSTAVSVTGMEPSQNGHDPVAANRAAHPRRTPGRDPLGVAETRRATVAVLLVVAAATAVLVAVLASAP